MTEVLVSSVNRRVPEMTPETDIGRQNKASHSIHQSKPCLRLEASLLERAMLTA